jgi:predicted ATPase/DNA-binding CsgD family transcriptional regulator
VKATTPVSTTPLIGREHERAWVRATLQQPSVRLLTLTGPGGVGKTRLARVLTAEFAHQFPDGAYFVSLAELGDPTLVPPAIAHAIGQRDDDSSPIVEQLSAKLGSAKILLTLDNLEQVREVTPELVQLLDACPGVTILSTSRAPLGVAREHVLRVPPLAVPDFARRTSVVQLRNNEAVRLLVQRAQVADPGFALSEDNAVAVARICVLLKGLPLALELAAARLQVLSPAALLERLSAPLEVLTRGDVRLPERQQTLRATIAWSDNLLSPMGRTMLRHLSVFTGGCAAAAAEAVCCDSEWGGAPCSVLDGLAELLDQGLLRREMVAGEPRFILSEMIHDYAVEGLEASGETQAAQRRHATYFLSLAEKASSALRERGQDVWIARLETERHNARAALRWSLAHDPAMAMQFVAALWRFWYDRGYRREARHWLTRTLATAAGEKSVSRVRALNGLGVLLWAAGDLEQALELQNASLALARDLGDRWGMAAAEGDRAIIEFTQGGDIACGRREIEDVLSQFRALGDRHSEGIALQTLGTIARARGDLTESTHRFDEALAIARESGDGRGQVLCICNLAQSARLGGELDQAAAYYLEGLRLAHRLGARESILGCLAGIGGLAVERREFEPAARLLGTTAALIDRLGAPLQPAGQTQFDHDVGATRSALPEDVFSPAWSCGRSLTLDEAVAQVLEETEVVPSSPNHGLSDREIDVMRLLVRGMTDREIAAALCISPGTAMTHVKRIRGKLGVRCRGAAVAYAVRHGLV